jgi:hypothetical protein
VRKQERDAFVDTVRCAAGHPAAAGGGGGGGGGVHRYRVRVDAGAGDDFCNHVGFVAGEGYRGSALNSAEVCVCVCVCVLYVCVCVCARARACVCVWGRRSTRPRGVCVRWW